VLSRSSKGTNFTADALPNIFWYSPTFCTMGQREWLLPRLRAGSDIWRVHGEWGRGRGWQQ
jgi:hypothetical protein